MNLIDLPQRVQGYTNLKEIEVIKVVFWWAHNHDKREWVDTEFLRKCYGQLSRAVPNGGFVAYLNSLVDRKPPHLIKTRKGYKLEHRIAGELSKNYGQREAATHVEKLLTELPSKVPNLSEKAYLDETLTCLRSGAFRATVVMAWNLAYDHLCEWILGDAQRLAEFNSQSSRSFPRAGLPTVTKRDDFLDFKESQVLQVAKSARVITDNVHKILKEKLDRRNIAAHPSGVKILQSTAEEVIRDLVENVVLVLK